MQGAEGISRVLLCVGLVILAVETPGWYGLALAIPPFIAVAASLRGQHNLLVPGPEAPYSELSNALGWLLAGSVLAQTLSYAPFLGVTLLSTGAEKDLVGKFIAGFFVARIPILLFQAVQAALLPKLASHAGAGRHDDFRAGLRRLIVVVSAVGVIGIVAGFTIAPWAGRVLFGQKFILGRRDLGLLAIGTAAFILALTIAQGLIALRAYAEAAAAWLVGIAVFVLVVAEGSDLFLRVEVASAIGALAAAGVMFVFVTLRLRSGTKPDVEDLVEVVEHEPLEI